MGTAVGSPVTEKTVTNATCHVTASNDLIGRPCNSITPTENQ